MKKLSLFLTLTICILIGSTCKEKEKTQDLPPLGWQIDFFLADSLGNNLLPYPLPNNPIRIPGDYKAYRVPPSEILGYRSYYLEKYGYMFSLSDNLSYFNKFRDTTYVYKTDSFTKEKSYNTIFKVQFCFADKCDTLKICADLNQNGSEHKNIKNYLADWIIYKNDTTFNVSTEVFPLKIKN
jgi:hypothetical protein